MRISANNRNRSADVGDFNGMKSIIIRVACLGCVRVECDRKLIRRACFTFGCWQTCWYYDRGINILAPFVNFESLQINSSQYFLLD